MIRTFRGTSQDDPFSREVVIVEANGKTRQLHPERSQAVKNHSPDGFNWGYGGSGPGQLTLAILLEVTNNEKGRARILPRFQGAVYRNHRQPTHRLGTPRRRNHRLARSARGRESISLTRKGRGGQLSL